MSNTKQIAKAESEQLKKAIVRQVGKLSRKYGRPNPFDLAYAEGVRQGLCNQSAGN